MFTERQLTILKAALQIASANKPIGAWWEIASLQSDIDDLLRIERERKRERAKSLRIEKRAARAR